MVINENVIILHDIKGRTTTNEVLLMILITKKDENGNEREYSINNTNLAEYIEDYFAIMEEAWQNPERVTDVFCIDFDDADAFNLLNWIVHRDENEFFPSDLQMKLQKAWIVEDPANFNYSNFHYDESWNIAEHEICWETFAKWAAIGSQKKQWSDIDKLIEALVNEFKKQNHFTEVQAVEVMIFFLIMRQIRRVPEPNDLENLKKRMKLAPRMETTVSLEANMKPYPVHTAADGKTASPLMLSIMKNTTSAPLTVPMEGWSIRRTIQPGDDLIAICLNGKPCGYAPRIAASFQSIYVRKGGKLMKAINGKVVREKVGFFNYSDTLVSTDAEGILQDSKKKVFWLRNQWSLNAEGMVEPLSGGKPVFEAWKGKKLISFDVEQTWGVALTFDRTAIDQNAEHLGDNIAAVSCRDENYILLTMDGKAITNRGEISGKGFHAVCADVDGFWAAGSTEEKHWLKKFQYQNENGKWTELRTENICVEEIEHHPNRQRASIVCLLNDGSLKVF